MSKSEDEDQMGLPDELKKLEINSDIIQQSLSPTMISKNLLVNDCTGTRIILNNDTNLPVSLNPFFYQIKFHDTKNNEKCIKAIFGTNCNININNCCEYNNDNVNDDNNVIRTGIIDEYISEDNLLKKTNYSHGNNKDHHKSIQHSLISQTKFKAKSRYINKKSILKESILKILQFSHVKHKSDNDIDNSIESQPNLDKLIIIEETPINNNNLTLIESLLHDTNKSNNKFVFKKNLNFNSSLNEFLDFRNIVQECNLILYSSCNKTNKNNKTKTDDIKTNNKNNNNNNNINNNNLNIEKIGNGTIIKNTSKPFTTIQQRNNRSLNQKRILRKLYTNSISESRNSNIKSIEHEFTPKPSCSQQARINISTDSTASCDVTIDELASYFETFVHIPKKMSEMAEMMYI